MLADTRNILTRWKNYFSQLLNVHSFSDVKQIEIHTAEPFVPDPSPSEVEDSIMMALGEKKSGGVYWSGLTEDVDQWRALVNAVIKPSGSVSCWEVLERLHN
jgi:hypothetical protein